MSVKKGDRLLLEDRLVTIQAVDQDGPEVTVFFAHRDGTSEQRLFSHAAFAALNPVQAAGTGDPRIALAALWAYWMARVTADSRQTALATTPLRAYAHQDEAVFDTMLPQPILRFLLADEPGTGKTIMAGMYIAEMRRQRRLDRVLLVVPAHLLTKWRTDLERFFGIVCELITPDMGRSPAPLRPDLPIWLVSIDLLARNQQVQRKVLGDPEAQWDLVVIDEAHRLTPSTQYIYPVARRLAARCTHLLLLTATPHRGDEFKFRALLHLLDPHLFPWSLEDAGRFGADTTRLRPPRPYFLRRMKEHLVSHDGITRLFPDRRALNIPINLTPQEQAVYEAVMDHGARFYDDPSGFVRGVYGKRAASSLYALVETLSRRAARLEAGAAPMPSGVAHTAGWEYSADMDADEEEEEAIAASSAEPQIELASVANLRARLTALYNDPAFSPAKVTTQVRPVG